MAIDDVSKWPSVDYGCVYTKFINIPGMYTAEALKSFRSHDSYALYHTTHVQTVMYHACMWSHCGISYMLLLTF